MRQLAFASILLAVITTASAQEQLPDANEPPLSPAERRERAVTLMLRPRPERLYAISLTSQGLLMRGNRIVEHLDLSLSGALLLADRWVWSTEARVFIDQRFDVVTAQLWGMGQRVDYFAWKGSSVFVEGSIQHDAFLGLDRQWIATLGVTRNLVYDLNDDGALIRWFGIEVGALAFAQEFMVSPRAPPGTVLARKSKGGIGASVSAWYEQSFAPGTAGGIEMEVRTDFLELEDTHLTVVLYVGARLIGPLAIRLFTAWTWDGRPATAIKRDDFFVMGALTLAAERFMPALKPE